MNRAIKILGAIALAIFFSLIGFGVYAFYRLDKVYRDARHLLLNELDHRTVSVACLDMMTQPQYQLLLVDHGSSGDDPRLPDAIRNVKASWFLLETNQVIIMKTGGFYHIGLVFHRSTTASNAYDLLCCEEGKPGHDILLYTLPIPTNGPSSSSDAR